MSILYKKLNDDVKIFEKTLLNTNDFKFFSINKLFVINSNDILLIPTGISLNIDKFSIGLFTPSLELIKTGLFFSSFTLSYGMNDEIKFPLYNITKFPITLSPHSEIAIFHLIEIPKTDFEEIK